MLGAATGLLIAEVSSLLLKSMLPAILVFFLLLMVLFALFLFVIPITSGIRLIKKEGFSLSHALSLLFGVLYFLYLVIWPLLSFSNPVGNYLYSFLSGAIVYLAFILFLYTLSAFLNMFPHHRRSFDYIVVLGSGLIKGKVPPLLASRIQKALDYAHKQNLSPTFVFSGGQGADEPWPEGEAMAKYALDKGLLSQQIIRETRSVNTYENIHFSAQLILADYEKNKRGSSPRKEPEVLVVTSRYHVFRALIIAKKAGLRWEGLGAKTKFYFSLNAFLREYIAYLAMTKKVHLTIGLLLVILSIVLSTAVQQWFLALLK